MSAHVCFSFKKPCFIGSKKSQDVNFKNKVKKAKIKISKTKFVVRTSLFKRKHKKEGL